MAGLSRQLECVLVKPAGPDCNLACDYCFYLPKGHLFPESAEHRMRPTVLEETIRQVMQDGAPQVVFSWQGGEPTLMGVEFFERVIELEKRYGQDGQVVGNGLQTNGMLIDDRWASLLREGRFLVGLSLDGPEHVHDHFRKARGGQPTWNRVVSAARRLAEAEVEVNALAVVTEYSARSPREIYHFFKDLNLCQMQFIPCLERAVEDSDSPAPFSVGPEQFGEFLCTLFDCWREDFKEGEPTTFVRWFDSVFATYVNVPPPECTLLEECGSYLVVEHNGDVFCCDFFVDAAHRLGNVRQHSLRELLNSPQQAEFGRRKARLAPQCRDCPWLEHCRGGCPKERWGSNDQPYPSRLCRAYQMFFEHADSWYQEQACAWLQAQARQIAAPVGVAPESASRIGRNDPCPCGSGFKYKRCCGR